MTSNCPACGTPLIGGDDDPIWGRQGVTVKEDPPSRIWDTDPFPIGTHEPEIAFRRMQDALTKIAESDIRASYTWSECECADYWASQACRHRSIAKRALRGVR